MAVSVDGVAIVSMMVPPSASSWCEAMNTIYIRCQHHLRAHSSLSVRRLNRLSEGPIPTGVVTAALVDSFVQIQLLCVKSRAGGREMAPHGTVPALPWTFAAIQAESSKLGFSKPLAVAVRRVFQDASVTNVSLVPSK